jgi:aspartate kinase
MAKESKIVMKFGGTSVQDSISIKNVIDIVRRTKGKRIVVVSAIAKGTNTLEKIARQSANGNKNDSKKLLDELIVRHYYIIDSLVQKKTLKNTAYKKIEEYKNQISELVNGLSIIKELSLRTLDSFRVFGEIMSSTVIYYSMLSKDLNVEFIDSRNIIKTDNDFSRAYPDYDKTQKNINKKIIPLLERNKIVLAQGFIASTDDGISTTMGRESSDFSAAIYGALINADEIQIWTDVDGVLTSDPNIIKDAYKLSQISFQEMEELSNFGAKVLHKNSVKPAQKKNIPIRILNSKNTLSKGTVVNSDLNFENQIKSITHKKNIIVLRLTPKESLGLYVFWEMMLNILNKHKPQIDILISSNNAIIIVISVNNYTKIHYDDLKNEFEEISDYKLLYDKTLITLVGSNLYSIVNLEQRIFISNPKLKAESIIFGYNKFSFTLLCDDKESEKILINLHKEFFENDKVNSRLYERKDKKGKLIA